VSGKSKIQLQGEVKMEKKQMSYSELVHHIKNDHYVTTPWLAVCWLIGYQGIVTETDYNNIRQLYLDGIVN
jgi:hypothetical protein